MLCYLIPAVVTIIAAALCDFFLLLPWSLRSQDTCLLLLGLIALFYGTHWLTCLMRGKQHQKKLLKACLVVAALLGAILLIGNLSTLPLLRAKAYASLMADDVQTKEASGLPGSPDGLSLVDQDSAEKLGLWQMELEDDLLLYTAESSVQQTFGGKSVRVMPLDFANEGHSVQARATGVPGYLTIDLNTKETQMIRLEQGMKYTPNAMLFSDLKRHVRLANRSALLGDPLFEIDDEGKPWWVIPVLKNKVGWFAGTGGQDVSSVLAVDPSNGEILEYAVDATPTWMDQVYPADLVIAQYNNLGQYTGGFFNSVGKKTGVASTTGDYGLVSNGTQTWLYTAVVGAADPDTTIGYIYVDLRTRETQYYPVQGATPARAMSSAESSASVASLGYHATYPMMLYIDGNPTHFLSLKDNTGLVKVYAMVNCTRSDLVSTAETIEECMTAYQALIKTNGVQATTGNDTVVPGSAPASGTITGSIQDIRTAEKEGTTYFYLRLSDNENWYVLSILDNESIVKLSELDTVTLLKTGEGVDGIVPAVLQSYEIGEDWWLNPADDIVPPLQVDENATEPPPF